MDPALVYLGGVIALLGFAYFVGSWVERRHYAEIRRREADARTFPATTFRRIPAGWETLDSALVTANVVISVDYFKRFLAGLRAIFGGRIKSYETLMDRARREALLRLKELANARGYHALINVRLYTSRLANSRKSEGTAGLEVLAAGTGLRLRRPPA
jgi:uncharacterized protein YbjQ (UPF0145 family)